MGQFRKRLRWLWDNGQNIAWIVGTAMSFAVPAWVTSITTTLSHYAPASWLFGGLIGLLFAFLIYAAYGKGRQLIATAKAQELFSQKPDRINPLEDTFRERRISVVDLVPPYESWVRSKTFIDCEILGPANVFLAGHGTMTNVNLLDCQAVRIRDNYATSVGVAFENCHFIKGKLYRCLLMIPDSSYERVKEMMPSLPWLTPEPPNATSLPAPVTSDSNQAKG